MQLTLSYIYKEKEEKMLEKKQKTEQHVSPHGMDKNNFLLFHSTECVRTFYLLKICKEFMLL